MPGEGTCHTLFRIQFSDRPECILRADLSGGEARPCEFLIDSWVQNTLERHGLPGPPVERVDFSRSTLPFDFELLRQIPGRPLKGYEDPETQAMEPALLAAWGRYLAGLHTIPTQRFGLLDVRSLVDAPAAPGRGLHARWRHYLELNLADHLAICRAIGAISSAEQRRIEVLFDRFHERLEPAAPGLLHGDPGHHNVFTDGVRITGVIDWEDALSGDPVFDLAYWGTFCRDSMRGPLLLGYREAGRLPEDFEHRYWVYYLRIALSKTVHRHRFGYRDREGRPPASQRIQKALARLGSLGLK
jgi:aminoglycoside phosphotransferase (APT) family kinase protein